MKVTQGETKPDYKPITIVLETEDEAKVMWAKLNYSLNLYAEAWAREICNNQALKMYRAFNDIYRPPEEER